MLKNAVVQKPERNMIKSASFVIIFLNLPVFSHCRHIGGGFNKAADIRPGGKWAPPPSGERRCRDESRRAGTPASPR